jgi:hypothetical protein
MAESPSQAATDRGEEVGAQRVGMVFQSLNCFRIDDPGNCIPPQWVPTNHRR